MFRLSKATFKNQTEYRYSSLILWQEHFFSKLHEKNVWFDRSPFLQHHILIFCKVYVRNLYISQGQNLLMNDILFLSTKCKPLIMTRQLTIWSVFFSFFFWHTFNWKYIKCLNNISYGSYQTPDKHSSRTRDLNCNVFRIFTYYMKTNITVYIQYCIYRIHDAYCIMHGLTHV